MRNGIVLFVIFFLALMSGCNDLVNVQPTYSYFLENKSGTTIRLLGYTSPSGAGNITDTLVDTTINNGANLLILSTRDVSSSRNYKSIGSELCDTMCIYKGDALYCRYWNFLKAFSYDSLIFDDPSTAFYEFANRQVYIPYDTETEREETATPKYRFCIE